MQRVLTFTAEQQDRARFTLLWQGFIAGAAVERQKNQNGLTRQDRKSETTIKRALQGVSTPDANAPEPKPDDTGLEVDRRPRVLQPGGGAVELSQIDYERLKRYVTQTPWFVEIVEKADELEDWLGTAKEVSAEKG